MLEFIPTAAGVVKCSNTVNARQGRTSAQELAGFLGELLQNRARLEQRQRRANWSRLDPTLAASPSIGR
jgi:hypothetical protein